MIKNFKPTWLFKSLLSCAAISSAKILSIVIVGVLVMSSCSNDNAPTEVIKHQNYVSGKVNNVNVSMNDLNANILDDKSLYQFKSNDQTDIPKEFDWEVKLIDTKDSTVTLFVHIDDLYGTNSIIYSPNPNDEIKTKNTCYATVTDKNKKITNTYHPTHPSPITALWDAFMFYEDGKTIKLKDAVVKYTGHRWPGINGRLHGTLTNDKATNSDVIKIDISFKLY